MLTLAERSCAAREELLWRCGGARAFACREEDVVVVDPEDRGDLLAAYYADPTKVGGARVAPRWWERHREQHELTHASTPACADNGP